MIYVRLENGRPVEWPVQDFQIKASLKHVSFPRRSGPDIFAPYGYEVFVVTEKPAFDSRLDTLLEDTPTKVGDVWVQQWSVHSLFESEETRAAEKAALDAEDRRERLAAQQDEVRAERNRRLVACDWTQVADAPVDKAAWAAYRQALREVPQQAGFPLSVIWPAVPE